MLVAQLCLTLCNSMDCSFPGPSVHGILQGVGSLSFREDLKALPGWQCVGMRKSGRKVMGVKNKTLLCVKEEGWASVLPDGSLLVAQMVKHLFAMLETQVPSLGWEDPLEKEMATHSSTLAWKIPWTEKTGRLQSMGLQRVGFLTGFIPNKDKNSTELLLTLISLTRCSQTIEEGTTTMGEIVLSSSHLADKHLAQGSIKVLSQPEKFL